MTTEAKLPLVDTQLNIADTINVRRLQIGCWIALIAIAAARAWFTRYALVPDSMSYLDIARSVAEGHPAALVHAYWSPGYPALVSFFFMAFNPNAYWEFPLVHLVNWFIFIAALAAFHIFWSEVLQWHRRFAEDRNAEIPEDAFWALGYAAFAIATLNIITVGLVGPDLLVAALCCLAAWSVLRLRRRPVFLYAVLLGCVLAIGYYVKAPFFPVAIIFVVCAVRWRPISRQSVLLAGVAIVAFFAICSPFVVALSRATGHLTFGDSARLSQAFYVNGVQYFRHWQGGPSGSGMPLHPTRKLNQFPEIYEFAAPRMGTYPPWFNPVYWNAGVTPHLNLKRQAVLLIRNLALEFQVVVDSAAELVCVAIILVLIANEQRRWTRQIGRLWFVWAPGVAALAMFALIHVEPRFLGGWLVIVFAGLICACSLPTDAGTRRAVRCIGAAAIVTVAAAVVLQASLEAIGLEYAAGRSSQDAAIASTLLKNGLHPGDRVAIIGDGTGAYWAHLARLEIVAEIPAGSASRPEHPALDFWESGTDQQQKALNILKQTGARVVVTGANPSVVDWVPSTLPPPWKKIDHTRAYVYFFPAK